MSSSIRVRDVQTGEVLKAWWSWHDYVLHLEDGSRWTKEEVEFMFEILEGGE